MEEKMIARWLVLPLLCWSTVDAQDFIVRGLEVFGMENEENMPVIVRDSLGRLSPSARHITIQFDVQAKEPPPLKIKFLHCNRDWVPERNLFVQDETHNTSFVLDFRTSPNGVEYYSYRYRNRFPDNDDIVRFTYSGNWIFRVMDKDEQNVYGEGRFFVVDTETKVDVMVLNDYLAEASAPLNQIHKVRVNVRLPNEVDGINYTTVDVYQNRRFFNAYRIDVNDSDPYTTVDGFNRGYRLFTISNILPGNEYRTLNISNVTQYPPRELVKLVDGVDRPRLYWRTGPDRNGTARLEGFKGTAADYLPVMFRLDMSLPDAMASVAGGADVFVVGPFNQWNPSFEDRLQYDNHEQCYTVTELLRRGVYDYQYITGYWDEPTRKVLRQDWVALEGNDWRTTNEYHTMVYYNDPRFGGFDRITGFGTASSPGTNEASSTR